VAASHQAFEQERTERTEAMLAPFALLPPVRKKMIGDSLPVRKSNFHKLLMNNN
jgi:hypothetical protein